MSKFKSSLVAVALASAASAQAANPILFDLDGTGGGANVISVDTFDWAPDNGLVINGANPSATNPLRVVSQGALATFITAGAPPVFTSPLAGTAFTFELDMLENATGIGTATVGLTPISGVLRMYYNPTTASGGPNQLAGTGYGAGGDSVLILTGTVVFGPASNGTFTDLTVALPGSFPVTPLDQFAGLGNNYPNVMSDQGSGNTNLAFNVAVNGYDSNFFLTPIYSLTIDLQDSSNNTTPFKQADAAALVVGVAPVFTSTAGGLVNGAPLDCAANLQTRCDFLIQTDGSTTFNAAVPEPGSLALLGFGLFGAAVASRRKSR